MLYLYSQVLNSSSSISSRNLRKSRPPKILMQLCIALILLLVILLAGFSARNKQQCQAVSVLIHYFVLASFCWMAVEGFNLYLCFVKVVGGEVRRFFWKASGFAWGKLFHALFITLFMLYFFVYELTSHKIVFFLRQRFLYCKT